MKLNSNKRIKTANNGNEAKRPCKLSTYCTKYVMEPITIVTANSLKKLLASNARNSLFLIVLIIESMKPSGSSVLAYSFSTRA